MGSGSTKEMVKISFNWHFFEYLYTGAMDFYKQPKIRIKEGTYERLKNYLILFCKRWEAFSLS